LIRCKCAKIVNSLSADICLFLTKSTLFATSTIGLSLSSSLRRYCRYCDATTNDT